MSADPVADAVAAPISAPIAALVQRAEELAFDLELGSVRAWKAAHPGALAIGHLPVWAPRELLHAAGALPVGVVGGGDRLEIIKGDACYQSYVCHIPRSVVELGLSGRLDLLDGMLFPSICDVIRNLSGVWRMLFPKKLIRYLDLPQNFDPEIGGAFFRGELERLLDDLVAAGARRPSDDDLRRSIRAYNDNRRLHEELYALRRSEPWRVPTAELYVVVRAGCVLPVEEHSALLREYLGLVRAAERAPLDNARVVVVGSFCEQPPLDLLKTLERAGCYVVGDDFLLGARFLKGDVDVGDDDGSATRGGPPVDPIAALAQAYLTQAVAHSSVFCGEHEKGADLVADVRAAAAEGVLFAAPSFCDPALLDQPMLQTACTAARIPFTSFKYSENTGQFQGIREQAGTFADAIKLWSEA